MSDGISQEKKVKQKNRTKGPVRPAHRLLKGGKLIFLVVCQPGGRLIGKKQTGKEYRRGYSGKEKKGSAKVGITWIHPRRGNCVKTDGNRYISIMFPERMKKN